MKDYRTYKGVHLADLTREEDTPWKKAYTGEFGNIIPDALIREYYRNKIKEQLEKEKGDE